MHPAARVFICGLVCLLASAAGAARAASFDCRQAVGRIEQTICSDPDLGSFDSQLQLAYAGALDRSLQPEKITADQRAWLKTRDACADAKCLSALYQRRIAALSKVADAPRSCAGSTTVDVEDCQAEQAARADRELARYLAAARKRLADSARDDPSGSRTTLAALDSAQKAWEVFRKAECEAVYDNWSGGTIRGSMYQACMQSLTKARTAQVRETWLSFGDGAPPLAPEPVGG
jgi:uncharacterized protein YecT (DUF1311 family)